MQYRCNICLLILGLGLTGQLFAQQNYVSKVWVSDNGNGTYKNPVLHADYSDPDIIRLGSCPSVFTNGPAYCGFFVYVFSFVV